MTVQDDVIYAALLIFSVPFGLVINRTRGAVKRQLICTSVGVVIVALVAGWHILHSLVTTVVNCLLIVALGPKKCHIASFIWCFGYIVFFRTTHYLGLPQVPAHANAVQLLLTLKLVGLAFEVHDTDKNDEAAKKNDADEKIKLQCRYQNIYPSIFDMFLYSYCYLGLLTGPYYKFRTYIDMIHQERIDEIDFVTPLTKRLKWVPLISAIFLGLSYFYNIEYAASEEMLNHPFWYRLWYMVPMFTIFRMRLYFAWLMSESLCMTANLGAYPVASKSRCGQGPTNLEALRDCEKQEIGSVDYDYETMHNISIYGCELATTIREGMRSWNMTVQFWLANFVYRRVPASLKAYRMTITMMVSSFWHGIYPGYYLSFIMVPPNQVAEDWMVAAFRDPKPSANQRTFDWVCWFWKQRSLDYMAMAFLLLGWKETLHYWGSIYYVGHIWVAAFLLCGYLFKPKKQRPSKYEEASGSQAGQTVGIQGGHGPADRQAGTPGPVKKQD